MTSPILAFVQAKLNEPGVALAEVSKATDVSLRSLQMLRNGESENAGTTRVERVARHFGYRFEPVPIDEPKAA